MGVGPNSNRAVPGLRISDFLISDPETNTMYEVEVMLGRVDETHIIRAIEYWDIERRRWPTREHRAVIVAEEITTRFFKCDRLVQSGDPDDRDQAGGSAGGRQDRPDVHHGAR